MSLTLHFLVGLATGSLVVLGAAVLHLVRLKQAELDVMRALVRVLERGIDGVDHDTIEPGGIFD